MKRNKQIINLKNCLFFISIAGYNKKYSKFNISL
jgi:hypothetical protein